MAALTTFIVLGRESLPAVSPSSIEKQLSGAAGSALFIRLLFCVPQSLVTPKPPTLWQYLHVLLCHGPAFHSACRLKESSGPLYKDNIWSDSFTPRQSTIWQLRRHPFRCAKETATRSLFILSSGDLSRNRKWSLQSPPVYVEMVSSQDPTARSSGPCLPSQPSPHDMGWFKSA